MYHAHFGLERGLFGEGIAADAAVFRGPKQDQLIAHFKLAFGSPSSSVVVRGPAGVGKTTLTAAALRATGTRLALAWINGNATNAAELLELILVELGIGTLNTTRIERLQLWRQFQSEMRATDSRLFVVVERAEDLSAEVLHALDQLTAPDAAGNPGANVVLLGNEGIDAHLAVPLLESLRQRIRLRAELAPFTEAELQDYLRHQVACAGGHYDHVFAPGTVAALYRYSQGIARLSNNLCEAALDVAAVQRQKLLTADLVAKTAVSLLGLAEPAPLVRAATTADSAATPAAVRPARDPAVSLGPPPASEPRVFASPALPATPQIEVSPARATTAARPPPPPRTFSPEPIRVTPAPVPATPASSPAAPAAHSPAAPAAHSPAAPAAHSPAPPAAHSPAPPTPVMPVLSRIAPAPASVASTPATPTAATAEPERVEIEYDGGATDVTDVALVDFPVLTDAVELPDAAAKPVTLAPPSITPTAAAAPAPRAASPAPTATSAVAPAARPTPAPRPTSRVETAYTAPRTVPKPSVPTPAPAAEDPDEDVLRQTQTMRAIAVAKSIDDISEVDAETLFSDAEFDLVAAALASAAEWTADDAPTAAPAPVSAPAPMPMPPKAQPSEAAPLAAEDPFAFFGLGDDVPLELIDDSAPPNDQTRKTASR